MAVSKRITVAALAGAGVALAAVIAFGPLVRAEANRAAGALGAELDIERVTPTWRGVRLRDVDVRVSDVSAAKVHFDEVVVGLVGGRSVALHGGLVSLVGSREEVTRQVEAWRAKHSGRGGGSGGSGTKFDFEGLTVGWQDKAAEPTQTLGAKDLRVERTEAGLRVEAESAKLVTSRASVEVSRPRLSLVRPEGSGYRVHELAAANVEAMMELPSPAAEKEEAPEPAPAEPPAKPRKHPNAAPAPVEPDDPADAGRGAKLRGEIVRVANAVDATLERGAHVHLAGVHARLRRGEDTLNLGPGAFDVHRDGERLEIELSPEIAGASPGASAPAAAKSGAAEQAVTFHLSVPLSEASGDVVADVHGGPIGLAALGVREGDFGLFDVANASVVTRSHVLLSGDGRTVSIDGEGKVHHLSIRSAALSDEPVAGLELAFRIRGDLDLDGKRVSIDEGEIDLGAMRMIAHGTYQKSGASRRVAASYEMPLTGCQSMLDSAPKGLVPKLKGMRLAGSFSIKGTAHFDTANLDHDYKVNWDVANSCRVTEAPPDVNVERFRHAFRHTVYTPEGKPTEIESGPETPEWVSGSRISKFMEVAVQTTEDGGFQRHHGFDHEAIRNSIRENLRKMKFVRGASTISMQLAKNVYLDRTKNASRKLQEAVLTMYLEQELTKEQILELYLNVIEFGPMIYGIGPAARYYFNTSAADLSLGQALYISSIMPNPKVSHFGAGGAVSQSWMSYLRKLMRIANERHRVTDEELEEGLRESLIRGSPPERSARPHEDGHDDEPAADPDWIAP